MRGILCCAHPGGQGMATVKLVMSRVSRLVVDPETVKPTTPPPAGGVPDEVATVRPLMRSVMEAPLVWTSRVLTAPRVLTTAALAVQAMGKVQPVAVIWARDMVPATGWIWKE